MGHFRHWLAVFVLPDSRREPISEPMEVSGNWDLWRVVPSALLSGFSGWMEQEGFWNFFATFGRTIGEGSHHFVPLQTRSTFPRHSATTHALLQPDIFFYPPPLTVETSLPSPPLPQPLYSPQSLSSTSLLFFPTLSSPTPSLPHPISLCLCD